MVKMKKLGKKKALTSSWEGPYQFVGYVDGNDDIDFDEGNRLCIIQDVDEHQWEQSFRDSHIYRVLYDWKKLRDPTFLLKKVTYVT